MKTLELSTPKKELKGNYKIEHLPGVDVVLNLDYPSPKDRDLVLEIIKHEIAQKNPVDFDVLLEKIRQVKDSDTRARFYVKDKKGGTKEHIDFARGRSKINPINPTFRSDFDTESIYARASVLNEITLSEKIKEIISKGVFQKLAKKYGYAGLELAEPIAAFVDKESTQKYAVYKNIKGVDVQNPQIFIRLADELRKLFLENGIIPHDLKWNSFMIVRRGTEFHLVLIDIEAYTKKKDLPK